MNRHEIAHFLESIGGYYGRDERSYFAFDVKAYGTNLSFENLIDTYCDLPWVHNPEWLAQARKRYEEVKGDLFQEGVNRARRLITDSDYCRYLPNGTKLDVSYIIMGSSGGYIGIEKFEGYDFTKMDREYWKWVFLHKMKKEDLDKLYELTTMLSGDWTPEKAEREIEYQAAFYFVEGVCGDIPTQPEDTNA